MAIRSINPATGDTIREYEALSGDAAQAALRRGQDAFQGWRRIEFARRSELMRALASVLRRDGDRHARLMAEEMGKPIRQGRGEVEKCAVTCEFYAAHAEEYLRRETVVTEARKSFVSFEPLGIVLAVMPWNFPFWQVFRCAVPAIMAGNAVALKHASNVPGCALAIEACFREAGFPGDLFQTLLVGSEQVPALLESPFVKAVSLTGSVGAGRAIAERSGALLKKTVLELGGSDPYVVLEDCDLDRTVETCVRSRLINSGQSCIAAKRFIVVRSLRARFEDLFVARLEKERMGDPLDEATTVGPLARLDLRDELHSQVERSVREGATLRAGGHIPEGPGSFYPPTVLSSVRPGMTAFREETFGPVAAVIEARDEADALQIANETSFGLGAAVFTEDLQRAEEIAAYELDAGVCFVNDFVKSDPRLPFGGIKDSGYGRELSGFGIREFVNVKTVWVR